MQATCPVCRAQVEVRVMKSLLLLDQPDEDVPIAAAHMRPAQRGNGELQCEGSNKEVPLPYVPTAVAPVAPPLQRRNPYEAAGRAEKVRKITEAVDRQARMSPHAPPTPQAISDWLAGIDMHTWTVFAGQIGVNAPSAETIGDVLAIYRARAMHSAETVQRQAVSL